MKKIILISLCTFLATAIWAQKDSTSTSSKNKKILSGLSSRSNDHLMIQLGYPSWAGKPDTIHTGGLPRTLNIYLMLDFPFKTNPHLSMAFGAGIGSDHISFKKTYVGIKDATPTLRFINQADTTHFKKTILSTTYVEAPIELRYSADPLHPNKGLKAAIGVKVGALLNAHTRSKDLQNSAGNTLLAYVEKESSKRFINGNRISVTGRVGYGHLSLFGSYQVNSLFKDGVAPAINPFSIGITLSGL